MIDVLLVEDSPSIREYLRFIVGADPVLRVTAAVESGEAALEYVATHRPDVILLDMHLPGIDGLETTRRIMASTPLPIVVCTGSSSGGEVQAVMRAIDAGALTAVRKPRGLTDPKADADAVTLRRTLKLMSEVKVVRRWHPVAARGDEAQADRTTAAMIEATTRRVSVVAMGASTGGPSVLAHILTELTPEFSAPVLVVQHISPGFTQGFAEWLAQSTGRSVRIASDGERPQPGHVYVAPDDRHLLVDARGLLHTSDAPPSLGLRPSVGVLFRSVLERYGRHSVAILLTGMGTDGAEEMKLLNEEGALTVAQNEESCVVFGMPGAAVRLGAVRHLLTPTQIAALLNGLPAARGAPA